MNEYKSKLILDICSKYNNLSDIESNIFKPNVNKDIEELQQKINSSKDYLNNLCTLFDKILNFSPHII